MNFLRQLSISVSASSLPACCSAHIFLTVRNRKEVGEVRITLHQTVGRESECLFRAKLGWTGLDWGQLVEGWREDHPMMGSGGAGAGADLWSSGIR